VKEKNDNTKPFSLTITIFKVNFDEQFSHWESALNVNNRLQAEYTAPTFPSILDEIVSYLYKEYYLELSQDANNPKYSDPESPQAREEKENITNEILALLANLLPGQNEKELWMNGKNKAFLISPLEMIEKGRAQEVIAYLQTNTQGPC
jgi:hypothetical protein